MKSGDEALKQLLALLSPWPQRWKPEAPPCFLLLGQFLEMLSQGILAPEEKNTCFCVVLWLNA